MHRSLTGRLLPVTMVGSYPRPRWFKRELHGMDFREAWLSVDWWEEWTDALKGCLADQRAAGLDIVTDGELYDYQVGGVQWLRYFAERIGGVRRDLPSNSGLNWIEAPGILQDMMQRSPRLPLVANIERGTWRFADINRIARQFSTLPVKCAFIDPQRAVRALENRHYAARPDGKVPAELMSDLMHAVNEELRDIEAGGCPIFQNDEPMFAQLGAANASRAEWDESLALHAAMLDGVGSAMQIWVHLCWGNPAGQRANYRVTPSYKGMMDRVFDARFDVLNIEVWHDTAEIDLLAAVPKDRGVALGLINHRSTEVPLPEDLAVQIRRALKYVEPDRLYLTTACGLVHLPRQNAFFKLKALADAAAIVRAELTGRSEPAAPGAAVTAARGTKERNR